jgi:hypothetical protein
VGVTEVVGAPSTYVPWSVLEGIKRALIDVGAEVARRMSPEVHDGNETVEVDTEGMAG